jgi:cytochrome b involved in lipid metabolism
MVSRFVVVGALCFLVSQSLGFSPTCLNANTRRCSWVSRHSNIYPISPLNVSSLHPDLKAPKRKSYSSPKSKYLEKERHDVNETPQERFRRTASDEAAIETPAILTIHGNKYNMTAWAKSHPGGASILKKFNGKDATLAFEKSGHSQFAYDMLKEFEVQPTLASSVASASTSLSSPRFVEVAGKISVPLWRKKLFTKEDPIGVHKFLGIYVLIHFAYRIGKMLFFDPSAGLATNCGRQSSASFLPILFVLPHGMLSLSSLIFHTVPRERIVGKPMIWQEFRVHNIIFGLRSVICTSLAWSPYYFNHNAIVRKVAVVGSGAAVLAANAFANEATDRLRDNTYESTTATMPYWEGCSIETQRRFKSFYAYSQFMATIACLAVGNPAWPLSVLLAIQLSSLLMTLVRKSLISAKAYHLCYSATLTVPYLVAMRGIFYMKPWEVPGLFALGGVLYQLRRRGIRKFALWVPVVAARLAIGDAYLSWNVW